MNGLEEVPCPLCGASPPFPRVRNTSLDQHIDKMRPVYGDAKKSVWCACARCGFVHQNPRPSKRALDELYADSVYHGSVDERNQDLDHYRTFARWYFDEKIDFALRHAHLTSGVAFEVGAGCGGALDRFVARGFRVRGVEPDPAQAEFARTKLGLDVKTAFLDDDTATHFETDANGALRERADVVFSNHAFEHFADLHAAMRGLTRIVKQGGFVFTCIPTYARNRSDLSLQWMNAGHLSMFTHASLNQLFARHGFVEVAHTYRGWRKEIDDLWHLAQFAGHAPAPETFFESPQRVRFYVDVVNPIRSAIRWPVFHNYGAKRVAAANVKRLILERLR